MGVTLNIKHFARIIKIESFHTNKLSLQVALSLHPCFVKKYYLVKSKGLRLFTNSQNKCLIVVSPQLHILIRHSFGLTFTLELFGYQRVKYGEFITAEHSFLLMSWIQYYEVNCQFCIHCDFVNNNSIHCTEKIKDSTRDWISTSLYQLFICKFFSKYADPSIWTIFCLTAWIILTVFPLLYFFFC